MAEAEAQLCVQPVPGLELASVLRAKRRRLRRRIGNLADAHARAAETSESAHAAAQSRGHALERERMAKHLVSQATKAFRRARFDTYRPLVEDELRAVHAVIALPQQPTVRKIAFAVPHYVRRNVQRRVGIDVQAYERSLVASRAMEHQARDSLASVLADIDAAGESLSLADRMLSAVPLRLCERGHALVRLNLARNFLFALPDELAALDRLESISLASNRFRAVPPVLVRLVALLEIDLSFNFLRALPDAFGALAVLQRVDLTTNQLGAFPPQLLACTGLERLELGSNSLTELPAALARLTQLTFLDVSGNHLHVLPAELCHLTYLRVLLLDTNRLTALPDELGALRALQLLDVSNNRLTALPASLGALQALSRLNVCANLLSSLPHSVGSLHALESLGLDQNLWLRMPLALRELARMRQAIALDERDTLEKWLANFCSQPPYSVVASRTPLMQHLRLTARRASTDSSSAGDTTLDSAISSASLHLPPAASTVAAVPAVAAAVTFAATVRAPGGPPGDEAYMEVFMYDEPSRRAIAAAAAAGDVAALERVRRLSFAEVLAARDTAMRPVDLRSSVVAAGATLVNRLRRTQGFQLSSRNLLVQFAPPAKPPPRLAPVVDAALAARARA